MGRKEGRGRVVIGGMILFGFALLGLSVPGLAWRALAWFRFCSGLAKLCYGLLLAFSGLLRLVLACSGVLLFAACLGFVLWLVMACSGFCCGLLQLCAWACIDLLSFA